MDISRNPLLSIIIATRNMASQLFRCLSSIAATGCKIEVIVKDCLSADNTTTVIDSYRLKIPLLRFINRVDNGIYDAWNQTLTEDGGPSGEWILFLGADDFLCAPWRFRTLLAELVSLPEHIDYATSPVILANEAGCAVDLLNPSREPDIDLPNGMPFPHQGLFHRRRLFASRTFDSSLRITGDYDFLCQTVEQNKLCYMASPPAVCMTLGGVSGCLAGMSARDKEALTVSRRHFPHANRHVLWKRLILSHCFSSLVRLVGNEATLSLADLHRTANGKTRIWNRAPSLPQALCLAPPQPTAMPQDQPAFSLLIATIRRKEPLEKLLDSLCSQTMMSVQVLIADQNPPGFLESVVEDYKAHLQIRVIQTPSKGVSRARNVLIPHATGRYIAFPDDDCFYETDVLEQAQAVFETYMHVHMLLGRWADPSQVMPEINGLGRLLNWRTAFKRGETYVQFYRKEVVDSIGGFDEE